MAKTNLDEIIDCPAIVIRELCHNNDFVSLLTNIPNANIEDEQVEAEWDSCVNDYDYIEGTTQENKSFLCVDTIVIFESETIKTVYLTLVVGVPHSLMSLKNSGFIGIRGNRRDNLIRQLDLTLRNSHAFGIGGITPTGKIEPVTIAGKDFACKQAVYKITNFAKAMELN